MEIAIILGVAILFGALFYGIAVWKKSNRWFWALMGLLFGPFALPFVFFAQPYPKNQKEESSDTHEN